MQFHEVREPHMEQGLIDSSGIGSNVVSRLRRSGHECFVYAHHPEASRAPEAAVLFRAWK
jgi:6-phosphogluconate dehydrogenase (decarboxylating)